MNVQKRLDLYKEKARTARKVTDPLADEIWEAFGHRLKFSQIKKIINTKGRRFTEQTFRYCIRQDTNAKDPMTLFLWMIGQCKIEMKEVPSPATTAASPVPSVSVGSAGRSAKEKH